VANFFLHMAVRVGVANFFWGKGLSNEKLFFYVSIGIDETNTFQFR